MPDRDARPPPDPNSSPHTKVSVTDFRRTEGRYRCRISLWIAISLSPGYATNSDTRLHVDLPAAAAIAICRRREAISCYVGRAAAEPVILGTAGTVSQCRVSANGM